jgi:hypothetical protein
VSCVIVPSAPIGLTSVSPVARHATIESRKESATAITLIHTGMSKIA